MSDIIDTFESLRFEEFENLIRASLTLAVSGLAEDPEFFRESFRGMAFRFDVPYSSEQTAHKVVGGWPRGALHNLIREICEHTKPIALAPDDDHEDHDREFMTITIVAPYAVSAHEVLEASARLEAALKRFGLDGDYIATLLKPA